ncbi:MAG: arylsulfatase [Bacteroidota bacterium]
MITTFPLNLRWVILAFQFSVIFLLLFSCTKSSQNEVDKRPNILLLVADDMGYTDLGCYGGEIETPNIDRLASNGIKFLQFHTAPVCGPTRAMLLSGNGNHIAGIGRQNIFSDQFGYEGHITDRVALIPELLRTSGYHTYIAGKWHLGLDSASNPANRGFEYSYVNLYGSGNHYNNNGHSNDLPMTPYSENGQPTKWKDGNFSTDFFTDKLIEFVDLNKADKKPFFAFAAYTAPHWPLQVDEKYWRKYEGRYDTGYEKLKQERLESLKQKGIISADLVPAPDFGRVIPWDSLTDDEKKIEVRKMELYAGMVDNLDVNIGRLIDYLEKIGQLENTLIIFMSDNGAAGVDFSQGGMFGGFIDAHYSKAYADMGKPNSFISCGPAWANVSSLPYNRYKAQTMQGGVTSPLIISGVGVNEKGKVHSKFISVLDFAPTLYEIAGITYPEKFNQKPIYPLKGNSLRSLFTNVSENIHGDEYVFAIEERERVMFRKGDWKIVSSDPPFDPSKLKLFNLSADPTELRDLRNVEKEKFDELLAEWNQYVSEVKIQFPTPKSVE